MAPSLPLLPAPLAACLAAGDWTALPRLEGDVARLFTAAVETYDYAHHASLGATGGRLYAFWSNGRNGEDLPGQCQRWSVRDSVGAWSQPRTLAAASMSSGQVATTTAINGGTAQGGDTLVSYYSEYVGRPQDGAGGEGKWTEPVLTGAQVLASAGHWQPCGTLLSDYLLNEGARRTARGRWLMTGEDHLGRTRVALCDAAPPACGPWRLVPVSKGAGAIDKNEPSWLQRPDGTLALFLRDDGGSHCLWLAESCDEGESWSAPQPTNMPDATSKCRVGRLSTGTCYCIWNPNASGTRIPLAIALSADGRLFDRVALLREAPTAPHLPGRFKGPGYQYPNALELGGHLHVIYSVNKEDVEVLSVELDALARVPRIL